MRPTLGISAPRSRRAVRQRSWRRGTSRAEMSGVGELSDPVAFVTAFSRLLRERGLDATPATSIVAVQALVAVDFGDRDDVYHALRAVFVSRHSDLRLFDAAFDEWWGAP